MGVGERVGPLEPAREYRPALSGGNGDTNSPKTIHPTSAHLLCALGEGWGPSLGFSSPSSNTCRVDRNAKPFSFSEQLLNIYASPSGVPPSPGDLGLRHASLNETTPTPFAAHELSKSTLPYGERDLTKGKKLLGPHCYPSLALVFHAGYTIVQTRCHAGEF